MPETLANKIAAGEVVQRPASAAKELVENAIDAGADHITIILKGAGSELIQVIDDGCGMCPPDAITCFRRHATSKIRSVEDLEKIQTLGFRGEALASIAAVAQVELKTKRVQDEAGFSVRVHGGAIVNQEPCAAPNGTSVSIRNLFYNVPARRNFLKTPATEFKHLLETFQFLALSNPQIGFTLIHDDHEVYRLNASPDAGFMDALRSRIGELFGSNYEDHLIPVDEATSYLSASGFVANAAFHRRSRGEQYLFVNGRFIKNRFLEHAVFAAYEKMLPDGAIPFFALFLTLDPRHIDINVHPTKAEIKFDDERGVYGFVRAVVRKALGVADLTPQMTPAKPAQASLESAQSTGAPQEHLRSFSAFQTGSFSPERQIRHAVGNPSVSSSPPFERQTGMFEQRSPGELSRQLYDQEPSPEEQIEHRAFGETHSVLSSEQDDLSDEHLLWQFHDRYILTQIRSGLMVLDQNAAHQRILYERALQSMKSGFGLSQQLLFPQTIEFNLADFALLQDLIPDLRSLGFDLELFGGRTVVLRGVPTDIRVGDELTILEDILEQFKDYRDELHIKGHDNLAKSIARRSAIAPGKKLTTKEMRALIDQLFLCEMPYADPHGQPTMIKISMDELTKRFGG